MIVLALLNYVNTLQGTESDFRYSGGNTFPLISMPFGMTAWSPQTNEEGGGWFFHPRHRHLEGIRLTHQPSPWIGDYGHLTILPQTGPLILRSHARTSSFKPEDMVVSPHYFSVSLHRYRTKLELTPTERCAALRMTFENSQQSRLIISPLKGESYISFQPDSRRITGFTRGNTGGVPDNFAMYFVFQFDTDFNMEESGIFDGDFALTGRHEDMGERMGAYIGLCVPDSGKVEVKCGTSFISEEQAVLNLDQEIAGSSFENIRSKAEASWEDRLGRIVVESRSEEELRTFYSCMYRTCLFPRTWHENNAEGERVHFSPFNGEICKGPMYSDIGLWDVYRTSFPLYSVLFPSLLGEIMEAWSNAYQESGWLPKWLSPGERSAMPGTLIDAAVADAVVKGIGGFDTEVLYEGLLKHADRPADNEKLGRRGIELYKEYGYLPHDCFSESVSNTLDYVYGDFCIAQIAKTLGKQDDYERFMARAQNYKLLFDTSTGFMRGRNEDGTWQDKFDPLEWGDPFCEGGAWQGSWAVPHDFAGLAELMGGEGAFADRLDQLMSEEPLFKVGSYGMEIHEMSEMATAGFGQFAISNQPSFHIPYIYARIGELSKTQFWVRKTMAELFSSKQGGFPGDEDNGSMGAWYIWSAIGLYPLSPGIPEYIIGSPLFSKATIHLENGRKLVVEADNNSPSHVFSESISWNGALWEHHSLPHEELKGGGVLNFRMSCNSSRE
ncbi:GH92 family glycosyl hydrolase [Paenibacillus anaericanus]|uniref:GH92 family glycosyl hydrolase n=1 Tax=Paenibacillus anaericanus TaxID=170367 RepID=UPI0027D8E3A4|nr:GH92 family glycosyl hydrolase [Paenibacillus anaericanus]